MLKVLAVTLSLWLLSSTLTFASGFQLKSIGAMSVTGAVSSEWWYTSANPILSGVATADSQVTINIDGVDQTATTDSAGNWAITTTTLTDGDHTVSLTSSAGSQSFTLHIGADIPADISAPATTEMPVAGAMDKTMALWLGAMILMLGGVIFYPVKK